MTQWVKGLSRSGPSEGSTAPEARVVRAQRRPESELIHSKGAVEDQRRSRGQSQDHERHAPPSIDEREHVARGQLLVREDYAPVDEPPLSDSALRPHRPPCRKRKSDLVRVLRLEDP